MLGVAEVVELGQHRALLAQAAGDHVEDLARGIGGHFLLQARDAQAVLAADFAVVGRRSPVEQAQQRGLAGAVAADDGDALAGVDGEVDVFEQEGAADAEVDRLECDQGHGASLRGARLQPAHELQDSIEQPAFSRAQSGRRCANASRPGWSS